jgi:hypothetical protein
MSALQNFMTEVEPAVGHKASRQRGNWSRSGAKLTLGRISEHVAGAASANDNPRLDILFASAPLHETLR